MTSRVMRDFDLLLPESVAEVLDLLATHKNKAAILAGGTDLLVALKFNYSVDNVISLALVPGLNGLSFDPVQGLTIGAKVTIADILKSKVVKEHYPALWQAAKVFATPQLRNTATVLGNILRASPAGDCSLALYACGGSLTLKSKRGSRQVNLDDFWISYGLTARRDDELAMALQVPAPVRGQKSAFRRMTRTKEDLSKINAAVSLQMEGDVCMSARVAMGCVGPTLLRLPKIEKMMKGSAVTDGLLQKISDQVAAEISPIDDKRSSAEYRNKVAGVLVKRVIALALNGKGNDQ
ncbi:MAG: FAD binding domain-containing protein [Emcibacter sp.]|nr:FAD binding domain-containing protein [Emcibacter sp.]